MYGASAAYITDEVGRLLIVKPNYRDYWHLPGGMIDAGETPAEACRRECLEELGRRVQVGKLLCCEFRKATATKAETAQFIFACEFVDDVPIRLQTDELEACRFLPVAEALRLLGERTVRRLEHIRQGENVYLETRW